MVSPGPTCNPLSDQPHGMVERFENTNKPGQFWARVQGGSLGNGCGVISDGNSLYFDGDGVRDATTVQLDLRHIK